MSTKNKRNKRKIREINGRRDEEEKREGCIFLLRKI